MRPRTRLPVDTKANPYISPLSDSHAPQTGAMFSLPLIIALALAGIVPACSFVIAVAVGETFWPYPTRVPRLTSLLLWTLSLVPILLTVIGAGATILTRPARLPVRLLWLVLMLAIAFVSFVFGIFCSLAITGLPVD